MSQHVLVRWARLALGVVLLAWLVAQVDFSALAQTLTRVQPVWVVAAFASFLLSLGLKVLRWRWLLQTLLPQANWWALARALFLGQAVNIVGIGRWGEVVRVLSLQNETPLPTMGVLTSIAAEKILDTLFLGLSGSWWLIYILHVPGGVTLPNFTFLSVAGVLTLAVFAAIGRPALERLRQKLLSWPFSWAAWLARRITPALDGLAGLTDRRQFAGSLVLSMVIWGVMLLTNAFLLKAFDLPIAFRLALSVLVMGYVGGVANLTPGNIGPMHWAFAFALTLFDISPDVALSYAIVMHALITVVSLLLALALNGWQWSALTRPVTPQSAPAVTDG